MRLRDSLVLFREKLSTGNRTAPAREHLEDVDRCLAFLDQDTDCFERSNAHGHFTGSALVVDLAVGKTLLVHHRKYGTWLQTGGHCDGIRDPFFTAWEEAYQETGLKDIRPLSPWEIVDVAIQPVSEYEGVPAHLHYDIRYAFAANSADPLVVSDESNALAWVKPADLPKYSDCRFLKRLVETHFDMGG